MAIAGIKFKHANMYLHVWVGIDGDGLLRVVLADVHEHLVRRQAVAILHDGYQVENNELVAALMAANRWSGSKQGVPRRSQTATPWASGSTCHR